MGECDFTQLRFSGEMARSPIDAVAFESRACAALLGLANGDALGTSLEIRGLGRSRLNVPPRGKATSPRLP